MLKRPVAPAVLRAPPANPCAEEECPELSSERNASRQAINSNANQPKRNSQPKLIKTAYKTSAFMTPHPWKALRGDARSGNSTLAFPLASCTAPESLVPRASCQGLSDGRLAGRCRFGPSSFPPPYRLRLQSLRQPPKRIPAEPWPSMVNSSLPHDLPLTRK